MLKLDCLNLGKRALRTAPSMQRAVGVPAKLPETFALVTRPVDPDTRMAVAAMPVLPAPQLFTLP